MTTFLRESVLGADTARVAAIIIRSICDCKQRELVIAGQRRGGEAQVALGVAEVQVEPFCVGEGAGVRRAFGGEAAEGGLRGGE